MTVPSESTIGEGAWTKATQERIDAQTAYVATLIPGSQGHHAATLMLLLLMDSLHVLDEAQKVLRQLKVRTTGI